MGVSLGRGAPCGAPWPPRSAPVGDPREDGGEVHGVRECHGCNPTKSCGQIRSAIRAMMRDRGHPGTPPAPAGDVHDAGQRGAPTSSPVGSRSRPARLRRDVTRLRDLGYPIASTTGRYGGYELGAGGRLPPLLLDDDEAIAVSVALRELSVEADPTLGEAALSASTKLRQVLPEALRDRVDALGEVVVGVRQRSCRDGRRMATPHRAAQPDDAGDVLPARRACPVHLPRRRRPHQRATCRTASAGVARPALVPRRLRPRPRRLADVPRRSRSASSCSTGHRNTPRETPDAGRWSPKASPSASSRPATRVRGARHVRPRGDVHRADRRRRRTVADQGPTRAS